MEESLISATYRLQEAAKQLRAALQEMPAREEQEGFQEHVFVSGIIALKSITAFTQWVEQYKNDKGLDKAVDL